MNREEAIQILDNERPHCGEKVTYSEGERCEAYDMAIEALRERPKGQWLKDSHGPYCSNCKRYTPLIIPEDFCGKCGSDNRG